MDADYPPNLVNIARRFTVHGPQWEARSEFIRNVVGIAAAIFAGTITFSNELIREPSYYRVWLVLGSWLLLLISIGAGLFTLWTGTSLRSIRALFFYAEKGIEKEFEKLAASASTEEEISVLKRSTDALILQVAQADKRGSVALVICIWSFALSLVSFFVYAALRFGFCAR